MTEDQTIRFAYQQVPGENGKDKTYTIAYRKARLDKLTKDDVLVEYAYCLCNENDQFVKDTGRLIATERLLKKDKYAVIRLDKWIEQASTEFNFRHLEDEIVLATLWRAYKHSAISALVVRNLLGW